MSYRSHTTIPMRGRGAGPVIGVVLVGLIVLASVAAYGWSVHRAASGQAVEREHQRAAAIEAVILSYQQGQRDALEAIMSSQGLSLDRACSAAGLSGFPGSGQ